MKCRIILILLVLSGLSYAGSPPDSTRVCYSLFHPLPKDRMRSFETDRPDNTESPFTVDAGHFQYETDLFKTNHSSAHGIHTVQNSFNAFNLKTGLTPSMDLQLEIATFVTTRTENIKSNAFFGNFTVRIKQNIWGNDGGVTAMAILPFINIPTSSDGKITGGLILPLAVSLPNDWSAGCQIESDVEENQPGKGYHMNFQSSATFSHPLFRKLEYFIEGSITRDNGLNSYEYFINSGIIYEILENVKADTGVYYGLKNTSSKIYFLGISFRI